MTVEHAAVGQNWLIGRVHSEWVFQKEKRNLAIKLRQLGKFVFETLADADTRMQLDETATLRESPPQTHVSKYAWDPALAYERYRQLPRNQQLPDEVLLRKTVLLVAMTTLFRMAELADVEEPTAIYGGGFQFRGFLKTGSWGSAEIHPLEPEHVKCCVVAAVREWMVRRARLSPPSNKFFVDLNTGRAVNAVFVAKLLRTEYDALGLPPAATPYSYKHAVITELAQWMRYNEDLSAMARISKRSDTIQRHYINPQNPLFSSAGLRPPRRIATAKGVRAE